MRILFLSARLPFPPVGGERIRPYYFIKHLSKDWDIDLLSFTESAAEEDTAKRYRSKNLSVETVLLPRLSSYYNSFRGLFTGDPLEVAYYGSKKMSELIGKKLRSNKYDLIFCHLLRMADYITGHMNAVKVLDVCDALSVRYAASSRLRTDPFRVVEWIESRRLKKYERDIALNFDLNLISSSADKGYLEERGIENLYIVENGVEEAAAGFSEKPVDYEKIVFFANMRAFPNVCAVHYFYSKIFPSIKKRIRNVKFMIVGANVPASIRRMKNDAAVDVIADVKDIRPFVEDACVSVAPMRFAVGIQNKVLQSMAWKIPVVATVPALGGISAIPNRDLLLARGPDKFADSVIMLMQNRMLRQRIADNAHKLIREKYLWPDVVEKLNRKLTSLVENRKTG